MLAHARMLVLCGYTRTPALISRTHSNQAVSFYPSQPDSPPTLHPGGLPALAARQLELERRARPRDSPQQIAAAPAGGPHRR